MLERPDHRKPCKADGVMCFNPVLLVFKVLFLLNILPSVRQAAVVMQPLWMWCRARL